MTEVITEPKRVYVTCSGPGGKPQRPLVEVEPGTTPADLLDRAEPWRPWRAYAAQHLWAADASVAPLKPEVAHG